MPILLSLGTSVSAVSVQGELSIQLAFFFQLEGKQRNQLSPVKKMAPILIIDDEVTKKQHEQSSVCYHSYSPILQFSFLFLFLALAPTLILIQSLILILILILVRMINRETLFRLRRLLLCLYISEQRQSVLLLGLVKKANSAEIALASWPPKEEKRGWRMKGSSRELCLEVRVLLLFKPRAFVGRPCCRWQKRNRGRKGSVIVVGASSSYSLVLQQISSSTTMLLACKGCQFAALESGSNARANFQLPHTVFVSARPQTHQTQTNTLFFGGARLIWRPIQEYTRFWPIFLGRRPNLLYVYCLFIELAQLVM